MKSNSRNDRENILSRLRETTKSQPEFSQVEVNVVRKKFSQNVKVMKLKSMMEDVHTEVHLCDENSWTNVLSSVTKEKKIEKMLFGSNSSVGQRLLEESQLRSASLPKLLDYKKPLEESKDLLFKIDSAITSTRGGIAETGSLILWPSPEEPRLMSLIPPIHIAVLHAETIHNTFWDAMTNECWDSKMPSNVLLISGPSKTADIEQTLVYGVHGCKELVVLLIQ